MTRFPLQVLINIIAFLDDSDVETVNAFALVSRDLLPASRKNLLYSFCITSFGMFDRLVRLPDASRIAPYFFDLSLWETKTGSRWLHNLPRSASSQWFASVKLLNLHRLRWGNGRDYDNFHSIGKQFHSLTELTLSDCSFPTFEAFQKLLCAFGRLRGLWVEGAKWLVPPTVQPFSVVQPSHACGERQPRPHPLPHVRLLWFWSECEGAVTAFADWLRPAPDDLEGLRDLHDLKLAGSQGGAQRKRDLRAIRELIEVLRSSLEKLEISIGEWTKDDFIDLSRNTSLRSLHIRHVASDSLEFLQLLLERWISPANLAELELDLSISRLEELSGLQDGWSQVDNILARADFRSLTSVNVWLRKPQGSSVDLLPLVETVEKWMRSLKSRSGLLLLVQVVPCFSLPDPAPGHASPVCTSDTRMLAPSPLLSTPA